ncbi:hypothetical protein EPR50_G00044470 [Perca flavescens]|uniref:Uncharacterized protein n=1 Tax=Perca flavescens TaxID=8167 RepID=A0A484DG68_PERFV|nr:hypothetical protein EPR50_G00044470 [Perca flavescens]
MTLSSISRPDRMEEEKLHVSSRESSRVTCLQVLPSYLLAGLGMVTAGMLLDRLQASRCPSVSPSHSSQPWTDVPACFPLIKMKKSDQAHAEHQHSGEEKERELWREKEEKERQHRRAEKKMLAFWMSLSHKTRTLFRPRKRPGFQRSTSAVRLLKSEA